MAGDRLFRLIAAGLFASVLLSACGGGGGGGSGGGGDVGDGRVAVVEDKTPPISPPTGGVAVVEDETPPIDEENKPPPPEIMKADSDSPLSPQEPVLAATESGASESGAALLTVTVSNGGELLPFTDANGFASEGGSVAVISLSRAAAALFTADGLVMSLVLTATNAGGTVLSTVSFASSALGIDGAGLTLHLTTALLRSETELFAAADASLTIWHNGDKEEKYELSGLGWDLFTVSADGGVRVVDDLPVSGEGAFYGLTLRLTDGAADAERLLSLRLTPPQTEITPPRTEAPPLPEIEGELLGETKLVDALSGSGTALLAVTVSNGGALSPFADANGFASDGGAVAVISLARSATALFTLDGLTLSLALTATNAGGTVSETVSFASSARGFDGLGLSLHLTTALLRSETELFAAADARLTIWHNDGKEENYKLSGLNSQLFVAGADGGVRVAGDLPVSGEGAFYELTLRLTDGAAIAERLLFLRLTPPLPEIEGELLGETKLVNALFGSGTALLTVTVSNGGELSPFTDANGFASGGGSVAMISLARSATALFTLDGLTLSLALTATNAGGTVSETVSFASSARGFDGLGLSLHLTTALLRPETELFAATDSRLTIWHNDGKEENYELSGLDSQLFATDAGGGVRVASDLLVSGEGAFYELTLRLTDGAEIAERLLFLRLTPPLPEIEGVSGETKLVNALSGSGTALLTVTVSNGGALLSFSDANGFASDGGAVAVISLARSATALFTLDGLTLSLALTATNAGGTVSETVSFASSARGFDGLGLSLHLTTALLRPETKLFAATDASLTIWHNDGKEESYELSGLNSQLFATDADGEVRVESDLPVSGEGAFYELTLRLTDGAAIAERSLFLRLTPPLPEIEGELLGETKLMNALSGSGTALLAVTVSNGGALSPFTDTNGFASGGGAVAVISLARSATALFTLDGLTLSLALTATNAGGTVSETVSFASSSRGFDGLGLSLHLTTALLRPETELFAATDSRLTIWHNDGKEESYELSGLDSQLFAADADGGVRVASDLPVSGEGAFYELTLRLTDGAEIAERSLFLRLTPPLPEIEGVSGETKLVNALSGSGTALLTVTVSNGGALSPIADANGFASGGGAIAVISLARPATALFTLDGLTLSLALTATNAGGTVSATVSFASSARGFDGLGLSLHLTTALLHSETELFAATDASLTIWHNDDKKESYKLSGLDSQLFATGADGEVRVASDLPVSGEGAFYELTLRLTDGAANAERLLFLRLTPPPPEIEGVSGETKLVNALSGSGTALLTVTVSNGGELSPFTDANGFASGGGSVAMISLARSATALFTLDGLTLSLALTATNAGGTVSETVSFASSARGFDGLGLSLHLTTALLRSETALFAATDSRLTIWHNDGKEESYELSGLDSQLFATGADGEVRVASDLPVSGEGAFYELTLRLTDGAEIAERSLFLRLTPPLPEIEGVSGEVKLVNALSGSGTALLAVTVSNGGALSPFTDANGFASDGGAVAVISLSRSATALFTLDGLTLSLALTATNAGGTVSETVSFASSARGFDGLGLSLHLTTALLRSETALFAARDAGMTIWHNDGKKESYELSGLDSELFVADAGGGVRVASDLPVSGEGAFYELTLRLTDGAEIAERSLFLRLTPPLPEIEGVSGEVKLVNALSGSGTALLAVTVSNGGELSPFADAGFASGGGAIAVISLARPATALFTLDGLTLSLALTATNAGGTVSATVSFASSAWGFDGLGLSLHLTTALLRPETELFAATDSRLTIWHNDGKEESYELSGLDSQLFAADADGEVRVAADLPVSGEGAFYELTLRLTDGAAIAERLLFLRLTPPLPEIEGVSGEVKLVNALSGSGTALLAVTVSNGGALLSFADANGFASGGGAVAVISLARSATALFTRDGLTLSLALTATNAGGTVSETVSFVSSALGIDGAGLFASFATVMLPSETEVFAAADARLTIWHNGNKQETYELSGSDASLFAVDVNGGVRTASDLSSSEDDLLYELTLRLTDGAAVAERLLTLALLLPPIAVDVEVECAGQWPCRDQFAAALSAAIESGEATLDHGQAVVIDLEGGTHGSEVHSVFQLYGIGASVSLTLAEDEDLPRGGNILHTPDAFLELPAKKKQIVAHSVADLIAPAETLEEKDAIVAQAAANLYHPFPSFYRTTRRPDAPALITAAVETGLMVVVGGIAKTSERYELNSGYTEIDFDKRYTYKDYCDGTRKHKGTGGPPNVITLNGEEYCSVFDRCGWMQNYCLVAPAIDVVITETGQREDGTSFAAPQAAAALQMLGTMWPELSQRELALMLLELADDVGEQDHEGRDLGGIDHVYGHGVLSFRRLYEPGGLSPFIVGDEIFRFSCDADANTCQKSPIENVDSENEENKQPPEIIKADSDSPLSPQKPVLAAAESGTALLTVTVSNGALSPFTDANGFASEGGAVAVISLARPAAALFTLDGLTLSLALTATNAGGTVSATVSFVSSALGIDGAGLFASFATVMLPSETEVFAAADARLTIWHNDNAQETYELSGSDASLFAVDVNGRVRTASDLSSSEDDLLYELTLRLTDGAAIAERLLTLALLPPPIAVDMEVECAGQWPCRDQFAAALSAAIESGKATLDHGQAVVIDLDREGNTHGSRVRSAFQLYGSGASVSLTLAEVERTGPNREILHTPDAFLELPAKKKQIVAHSIADLIAPAETLEEKDAIVAQSAANNYRPFPSFYRRDGPALITAAVETGLMVIVGGIAKTSERYSLVEGYGYPEIDLNDRRTYFDYCDGTTNQSGRAGPPNVITLNGEGYCSVYDRCGWMQNYCLVAPAENILTDVETGQRSRGTSFAAPQAAAALQMLGTMWPELSSRELALMLLELADDIGEAGIDDVYGHGALSFRRLYEPGGLSSFIVGDEIFRFSCDADANTCQKSPIENVDSENEENKQPPEIIKADLDSPLSPQKPVLAAAESGTALLTVTVSNGALSPFADANGFASEGGAVAVISLTRSATALFTLDGLTLSLALTATNAGGTVSATVSFASSALGIDGAGLFASFATVMLPSETEVFAAADARLTIWHNGDKQETYELAGADASLFAVDVNGGVHTASDLSSSEDNLLYELTLRLTDGAAIAERLLTLALLPPPIAVDVEVECTGQWPCRDQFAAALSAAIESGEATLDHGQAVVIDREGNTHGSEVRSAFQLYGSGASVSLTLTEKGNTPDAFLELPAKKKRIVAHSVNDLIASAETLEEKDAIVAQAAANFYEPFANFYRTFRRPDAPALITAAVETGLMVVVGGIAKTSERYELNRGYTEIDFDKRYTYKDYCDGTRKATSGSPPNIITLNGEEYCSIYNRCGWMQNYCLVAPAIDVVITETGQREDGTSFAAPQAAAALQMLGTMWPELSQRELALMLLELADDIGEQDHEGRDLGGIDHVYGHGALSFRRLYEPGGLSSFIVGDEIFRFSCDADANTCQKERL